MFPLYLLRSIELRCLTVADLPCHGKNIFALPLPCNVIKDIHVVRVGIMDHCYWFEIGSAICILSDTNDNIFGGSETVSSERSHSVHRSDSLRDYILKAVKWPSSNDNEWHFFLPFSHEYSKFSMAWLHYYFQLDSCLTDPNGLEMEFPDSNVWVHLSA